MKQPPSGIKPESWLVSAGRASEPGAPLNVPLIPASNFIIGSGREYARDDGTPTWEALEDVVGGLKSRKAVAFASGMAAIASVFDQLAVHAGMRLLRLLLQQPHSRIEQYTMMCSATTITYPQSWKLCAQMF